MRFKDREIFFFNYQTKIVHDPDSESVFSRRSSLNSEEKHLFDELQNELMSLKRLMRSREEDANKKVRMNFTQFCVEHVMGKKVLLKIFLTVVAVF